MKYLSVCSGIEAATVAWEPLAWQPVAFSEIDPFPCAVLKHHYPNVPNWGDMTKFQEWPDATVDVLVGGTPCQSFSVAGLRKGLADPRGNLMLTYLAIAAKYRPRWLVWENVPGVLSSNGGRDFGSLLGGLAELGYGAAYRVLDAQFVRTQRHPRAVPQRRRRVFVVGCLGDWRRAAAVLFERESLSGNPAPRRTTGQAAPTVPSRRSAGGGFDTDFDCDGGLVAPTLLAQGNSTGGDRPPGATVDTVDTVESLICVSTGQAGAEIGIGIGTTLNCNHEAPIVVGEVAHSLRADGFDASEDGTGRGTPLVAVFPINADALRGDGAARTPSPDAEGRVRLRDPGLGIGASGDPAGTIAAAGPGAVAVLPFDTTQITHPENRSNPQYGDPSPALAKGGHAPAVAFHAYMGGNDGGIHDDGSAPTMTGGSSRQPAISFNWQNGGGYGDAHDGLGVTIEGTPPMSRSQVAAVAFALRGRDDGALPEVHADGESVGSLRAANGGSSRDYVASSAVRRLTPTECERLQAFPDGYTQVPYRGKPAADGPRYKALGNSMAVPCMAWIGSRIQQVSELTK